MVVEELLCNFRVLMKSWFYEKTETDTKLAGKSDTGHTHSNASTSSAGFMSNTDKSKLDGISAGANKITVDSSLSTSSTNPVQNKVVKAGLDGKSDTGHTHNDNGGVQSVSCSYGTVKCFKKNGWVTVYWENVNLSSLTVDTWTTIATLPYTNQTGANYYGNFQSGGLLDRFRVSEQGELRALPRTDVPHTGHYGYITYPTND